MYASVLYELREADFHEIRRAYEDPRTVEVAGRNRLGHIAHTGDRDQYLVSGGDQKLHPIPGGDQELHLIAGGDHESHPIARDDRVRYILSGGGLDPIGLNRWEKPSIAFTFLKQKIATTPILIHFDSYRPPVIVVYASKWAVSAALLLKHEEVY